MYLPVARACQSHQFSVFNGVVLRSSFLSTIRRAVSPSSLRKAPFHRIAWDLVHLGICPESHEVLISKCPRRNRALAWRGNSVCHCHYCDFDLREREAKRAHPSLLADLVPLANLVSHSALVREQSRARLPAYVQSLDSGEIWHTSMLLGLAMESIHNPRAKELRTRLSRGASEKTAPDIMATGFRLLLELDEYLEDLLSEIREKAKHAPSQSPARTELGALYDLVDPAISGEATAALFEERFGRFYRSRYRASDRKTSTITLLRWCDQTMSSEELLATAPSKFAARKMLPLQELRVGRGVVVSAYDRAAVEALVAGMRDAKAMTLLITESGMPRGVFTSLIERGVIRPASALVERMLGPGRVSESDWRTWLASVEARMQSPQGSTAIRFSAAVKLLGGGIVGWNRTLGLIEDGSVPIITLNRETTRLGLRWMLCRRRLGAQLPKKEGGSGPSLTAVLASHGIRASKALELARLNIVQTSESATIPPVAILEQQELRRFKENYVTAAALSAELGLALKIIPKWLAEAGVEMIGNGRPVIYKREDVEAVIRAWVKKYRGIGAAITPLSIAQLQYLNVPVDMTLPYAERLLDQLPPQKATQLKILIEILKGRNFNSLYEEFGVQTVQLFCFSARKRGVQFHVSRRKTAKSKLDAAQRDAFEVEIQRYISQKDNDQRISQSKLVDFVKREFGIDYDVKSISALVRRTGLEWPTDRKVLSKLTEPQKAELKIFSQSVADRIRGGEPGLSRKTVQEWIRVTFDVDVSLASVAKYNKDLGVSWPAVAGQKFHKIERIALTAG
ncbi:hypothetical protein ACFOWB_20800 [Chenggangzhangella methanolivorans]|uniref:hypothetical protein n=1 Tax=Chenggangzhangella methanolivorans TaxID=1437009 RepID=UPI00361E6A6F